MPGLDRKVPEVMEWLAYTGRFLRYWNDWHRHRRFQRYWNGWHKQEGYKGTGMAGIDRKVFEILEWLA